MAMRTYNLTDDVQLSIRGTTATHPDSDYVFGIFMDGRCITPVKGYQSMDWSRAVDMANWILEEDKWVRDTYIRGISPNDIERYLSDNHWSRVFDTSDKIFYESILGVQVQVPRRRDSTDYVRSVQRVIDILSTFEERSFYQIISDIRKSGRGTE